MLAVNWQNLYLKIYLLLLKIFWLQELMEMAMQYGPTLMVVWVKKVKNFRICAAACSQDVRCNSFTVTDPVQGKMRCRGHASVDIPEEQGVTLNGTRYYWGK